MYHTSFIILYYDQQTHNYLTKHHTLHSYMFVINALPSYKIILNAAVGNTIYN